MWLYLDASLLLLLVSTSATATQSQTYYASEIVGFSSEARPSANDVLGPPDLYPDVGAFGSWQSGGSYPEYLELGYPREVYMEKITVFETIFGGTSISQVSVWHPHDQVYVSVYTKVGNSIIHGYAGAVEVDLEQTLNFASSQVRVDFDCRPYSWCYCDAVSIKGIVFMEQCSNLYGSDSMLPEAYLVTQSTASHLGEHFLLAPLQSTPFSYTQLIISTTQMNATYSVENTTGDDLCSGIITARNPGLFSSIASPVISSDYTDRLKGWHVHSTGPEPISVLYTSLNTTPFSVYLAYPCVNFASEQYEYYGISFSSKSYASQIVIIACDNDTMFRVTPTRTIRLPLDTQDPTSPSANITTGETSDPITLHFGQTLLLSNSDEGADLTGTKITSNKPLTVVSGHQCANVPSPANSCQQLAVQIPPIVLWGTEFLLTPFDIRSAEQYYKIVAAEDDTVITYKESNATSFEQTCIYNAGGSTTLATKSGTFYYLSTRKPVFVVQLARGSDTSSGGDGIGNPAIATVSPTNMYIESTVFTTLNEDDFPYNAISITVKSDDQEPKDILYNGESLNCTWFAISNLDGSMTGYGCTFNVSAGKTHSVRHSSGGRVSVMVYGFGPNTGYAYLSGINFQTLDSNEVMPSATSPSSSVLPTESSLHDIVPSSSDTGCVTTIPTSTSASILFSMAGLLSVSLCAAVLSSVVSSFIASIVTCQIMKKRQSTSSPTNTTPIHAHLPPIYDRVDDIILGKDNIELDGNLAYDKVAL